MVAFIFGEIIIILWYTHHSHLHAYPHAYKQLTLHSWVNKSVSVHDSNMAVTAVYQSYDPLGFKLNV